MQFLGALGSVFGLGIVYFVGAIPAGVAMKLPLLVAAFVAWLGYSAGSFIIILVGKPLQEWCMKKFKINTNPEKPSVIMRAWKAYGLPALGLLAPVTIGSPTGTVLGLALGVPPWRLCIAISLGVIPWVVLFASLTAFGFSFGSK
ncbi:MAG: small multi-drug export protein [Chthoniobacterales bacterium]